MAKRKEGELLCDRCAREVVVKAADSGSLSYTCQHCDFRGYAPASTEGRRLLVAEMMKRGSLVTPADAPAVATTPASKPAANGLLMG